MIKIPVGRLELVEQDNPPAFLVRHADPVIKVAAELIEKIDSAQRFAWQLRVEGFDVKPRATISAGVLTLYPDNHEPYGDQIVYREVAYLDEEDCYVFAWPD